MRCEKKLIQFYTSTLVQRKSCYKKKNERASVLAIHEEKKNRVSGNEEKSLFVD